MAKKRLKTRKGNSSVAVDRISKLPDPVIYHILSFVPTVYAVQMSVLSRRWRRIWYLDPALQFSDFVGFHKRESFDMFVDKCLMHRSRAIRYIADSVVTSFKLHIHYSPDTDRPAVNRWSKSPIIRNNVKELDICGRQEPTDGIGDFMPSVALNGRSLSIIKLDGVKLDDSCSMDLPSLRSLCLNEITFHNDVSDTLRKLMIGSPSLEKFVLDNCDTFGDVQISSPSLKYLEFQSECKSVDFYALNLQSLVVYSIGCPPYRFFFMYSNQRSLAV